MKFLVSVLLLACATTVLADGKLPYFKPAKCEKKCKKDYDECKDVEVEVCAPIVYAPKKLQYAPVYTKKYGHGRRLQDGCNKVKKIEKVCEKKPCTVTTYTEQEVCKDMCAGYGRKLAGYYKKPVYHYAPKCTKKCEKVQVPVTKCLDQCVYEECPKKHDYSFDVKGLVKKVLG